MKTKKAKQPTRRLLQAGCLGVGLLSISHPTQVTAADLGVFDLHNGVALAPIPNPFAGSSLGVRVAVGDLDGDGFGEIIVGSGRGTSQIAVVALKSKGYDKQPFNLNDRFKFAGVNVAAGDLDGDGRADIIAAPASGGGRATVQLKATLKNRLEVSADYPNVFDEFPGGISVAIGDVTGDGTPDIIAGKEKNPKDILIKVKTTKASLFEVYSPPPDIGGVRVAAGDVNGDGFGDLIAVENDPPAGARSIVLGSLWNGKDKGTWIEVRGWDWNKGHVHVASGDLDGDGVDDLVVGSPSGSDPVIKLYSIQKPASMPDSLMVFHKGTTFPYLDRFRGGITVAVGDVTGDGYDDLVFGPAGVPEPTTIASCLVGVGAWLFGGWRRRRGKAPPG